MKWNDNMKYYINCSNKMEIKDYKNILQDKKFKNYIEY